MHRRYLEISEFRERALSAREKADKARRLAARALHLHRPSPFDQQAVEFGAKATRMERRAEELEAEVQRRA